ncbi:MAG: NUDIX domain-containing protein [Chlamydiales bacterium]|nr:NUDIX domain-containing protein [Chlamydiia bacterium]MCP5508200.1 NUDIX domain-containing protein [Chlamydiales bacterium]
MQQTRPIVTAGGLIVASDGTILLVKSEKWHGRWTVPGGKVELGESCEEAFVREVKEETGLDVENVRFAHYKDCIFTKEFHEKKHFVMIDFIADLTKDQQKDDVKLNEEGEEYQWTTVDEARKLPLNRELFSLLDHYENR